MSPEQRSPIGCAIRRRALVLVALLVTLCAQAAPSAHATPTSEPTRNAAVTEVDSVAITVSDADRAVEFYSHVLTFEEVADREVAGDQYEQLFGVFGARIRAVRMRLGTEYIELLQFLAPRGRPIPLDSHSNDRWFQHIAIVVSDMDAAYARLRAAHVEHASTGPQRLPDWNPNAGGIRAFYFRDPDEHNLEILAFPPDKGASRWHVHDGRTFLGIDHTAIVVNDTTAGLAFYRDTLGLKVVGTSDNYGTEQEHLNNVFGAHLRITSLRAAAGPGVEFLEYLAPRDGRPAPPDTRANDLWSWRIIMRAQHPRDLESSLRHAHSPTTTVHLGEDPLDLHDALSTQDHDGHAILISGTALEK